MKKLLSLFLVISILAALAGCRTIQSKDLMKDVKKDEIASTEITEKEKVTVTDVAVRLFQNSMKSEENTLVSPLSVLMALSMTANGANGETLSQMEEVLGMSVEKWNEYVYAYMKRISENAGGNLSVADSVWFTNDEKFCVNDDFLQTNADYYEASIYETAFDDSTREDINSWVEEKTDGMIKEIVDQIPENAVMYLVNALAFDADWADVYKETQVQEELFTTEEGEEQKVELMYSSEDRYLEDEKAKGFMKFYKGNQYAFVALLPDEGISVDEYVETLTGEKVYALISSVQNTSVNTALPKFEAEYDIEMSEVLKEMGMSLAFDADHADFTKLGTYEDGNIYINRVLHKTFISVAEKGTKAGAATAVEMVAEMALERNEKPKEVILDRPFVYMLIDCENQIPFFIGTVMSVE